MAASRVADDLRDDCTRLDRAMARWAWPSSAQDADLMPDLLDFLADGMDYADDTGPNASMRLYTRLCEAIGEGR